MSNGWLCCCCWRSQKVVGVWLAIEYPPFVVWDCCTERDCRRVPPVSASINTHTLYIYIYTYTYEYRTFNVTCLKDRWSPPDPDVFASPPWPKLSSVPFRIWWCVHLNFHGAFTIVLYTHTHTHTLMLSQTELQSRRLSAASLEAVYSAIRSVLFSYYLKTTQYPYPGRLFLSSFPIHLSLSLFELKSSNEFV